jgi:AcrR family transcriptional regulator
VGDLNDRRARKKAQTRQQIQRVAQQLFAEHGFETVTIADIARRADVAVQTVFNHFATKEELFFADRADWVDGAANAVRSRPRDVAPLTALREHFLTTIRCYLQALEDPEVRAVVTTLDASPALSAYERELHNESVRLLTEALVEACLEESAAAPGATPSMTVRTWASLTASIWLAAVRGLLIEQRTELADAGRSAEASLVVERLAEQALRSLEAAPGVAECCQTGAPRPAPFTGWSTQTRRAV